MHRSIIPKIAIIVPCYNEVDNIERTLITLTGLLIELKTAGRCSHDSFICLIDDGSSDNTWQIICSTIKILNCKVDAIRFSRNYGHQKALLAGYEYVVDKSDAAISIDADLQQDEKAIWLFLEEYMQGNEIVYGIRKSRNTDGLFKKYSALFFYKLMKSMGVNTIENHADYRLVSNKALKAFLLHKEARLFIRGIFCDIGFKSSKVYFDVREREFGSTKYSLAKMLSFAMDGITSFSTFPLKLATIVGMVTFALSAFFAIYYFIAALAFGNTVPGWASTVIPIYFLGGIQLFCIGIIGEYIGKIYSETKKRPRYIIEEELT